MHELDRNHLKRPPRVVGRTQAPQPPIVFQNVSWSSKERALLGRMSSAGLCLVNQSRGKTVASRPNCSELCLRRAGQAHVWLQPSSASVPSGGLDGQRSQHITPDQKVPSSSPGWGVSNNTGPS